MATKSKTSGDSKDQWCCNPSGKRAHRSSATKPVKARSVVATKDRAKPIVLAETVEQLMRQHDPANTLGKLPAEVDCVAYPSVHALTTCRTVYVGGITNNECAPDPELVGNAMVDAIGREPIHLRHFDIEVALT